MSAPNDGRSFIVPGHGAGDGVPRVELQPFDEASDPVRTPEGPLATAFDAAVADLPSVTVFQELFGVA